MKKKKLIFLHDYEMKSESGLELPEMGDECIYTQSMEFDYWWIEYQIG